MRLTLRRVGLGLGLAVALVGCERKPNVFGGGAANPEPGAPTEAQPPGPAPGAAPGPAHATAPAPAPAPAPAAGGVSGTVLETMDAASYTYAKLDTGHGQVWVAGPQTKLAVGVTVGRMDGQLMSHFHSDSLARTFDEIYFVNAYAVGAGTGAAPPTQPTPGPVAGNEVSGTVVETMNGGGYTYALIDHAGAKIWIAGPETKLAVGTKLGAMTGSLMTDFRSTTLARTFAQIYFINAFPTGEAAAVTTPTAPTSPTKPAATDVAIDKIAPAGGSIAIADVFAKKATLVGKPVVVRGKVVKVNDGILGRNWLHLRDGSGATGTNDLLVTSATATAKLGDVVVARGNLAADKDFGAGYHYDLLVEDATIAP